MSCPAGTPPGIAKALELHRWRPRLRALEAVAHLLYRHTSQRRGTAARAGHLLGERPNGRLPKSIQHRNGPARGPRRRRTVGWTSGPALKLVEEYLESVKKYRGVSSFQRDIASLAPSRMT